MKKTVPAGAPESKLEKEVKAAIERLVRGEPRNPKLKALAAKGKLRFTVTAVELESGYSRTNFGHKKCRYPGLRASIQRILKPKPKGVTQAQINADLRAKNKELSTLVKIDISIEAAKIIMEEKDEKEKRLKVEEAARKAVRRRALVVKKDNVVYLPESKRVD